MKLNLPTKITIIRFILIPVFTAIFFITSIPYNYLITAGVFALAAITDYFDGMIARKYNMVTELGKFLDPIADKLLVSTAFIIMLVSNGGQAILPWYASIGVAVILARELFITFFRSVASAKGAIIAADMFGKVKAWIQDVAIIVLLVSKNFDIYALTLTGYILFWLCVLATVISGIECIAKNKDVLKG